MRIRNLILCLFVAMFAVAAWTERASAQCWNCEPERCMWGKGEGCVMGILGTDGYDNCVDHPVIVVCRCFGLEDGGDCVPPEDEDPVVAAARMQAELLQTVLAINRSKP